MSEPHDSILDPCASLEQEVHTLTEQTGARMMMLDAAGASLYGGGAASGGSRPVVALAPGGPGLVPRPSPSISTVPVTTRTLADQRTAENLPPPGDAQRGSLELRRLTDAPLVGSMGTG